MKQIASLVRSIEKSLAENYDSLTNDELNSISDTLKQATNALRSRKQSQSAPPKGSEVLWLLAGENPRAFEAYARSFPNKAINQFGRNRQEVSDAISMFQNKITPAPVAPVDGVPKADLQSSNIFGFQYDPQSSVLRVRFNNGGVYEYDNVPPYVFKMFQRGAIPAKTSGTNQWGSWWVGKQPSLGASFHELIRDNFPYQKVA